MKQAHLVAAKQIELRDVPTPQPGPGEALVKVRAALTCGTDLKTYRRGHPKLPFGPFGHEASGDIVAVGSGVSKFSPGDAIMWVQTAPCGACPQCRFGHENLCEQLFDEIALGAYADHIVLPRRVVERNAFRKPETLSYIEAAFLEPFACVVHGWDVIKGANAGQPLPDTVAIIGAGTIGMLFLIVARQAKVPATVFARRDDRKELAMRLGAVDFQSTDSATFGRTQHETATFGRTQHETATFGRTLHDDTLHDGTRFDAVIESAGSPETWTQAIGLARPGGRILLFGGLPGGTQVPIDAERMHYEELTLLGSFHFTPADVGAARDLLVSGAVDVKPLISGVEPLAAVAAVFQRLDRHEGYKFALLPEGSGSGWV